MNRRGLAAVVLVPLLAAGVCGTSMDGRETRDPRHSPFDYTTRGGASARRSRSAGAGGGDRDRVEVRIPRYPVLPPLPDGSPPVGLEGFCPVTLVKETKWRLSDVGFHAVYEGRSYVLAGKEQREQFLAEPGRYAPVLSGDDAVLYRETKQRVAGRREHGVFFRGHVYLFRDEDSLSKFARDPSRYAQSPKKARETGTRNAG